MENERMRCFIDTNILIYAYSSTELSKKEKALFLLKEHPIFLSTQVLNEFLWAMNRKFQVEWDFLKSITDSLFILYPVTMISESTIQKAIDLASRLKYSYWDSLMISSALETDCEIFYTEDLRHGQMIDTRLKVVNPFQ